MEIRTFLVSFQNSLTLPDKEILKQFRTSQSAQSLLEVIKILQNKDEDVQCQVDFDHARITELEDASKVDIPVRFSMKVDEGEDQNADTLTLWVALEEKKYIVVGINGEEFYQAFVGFKNDNRWKVERQRAYRQREAVYDVARKLEQQFDTVIWYVTHNGENYFYVAEGSWKNYFLNYSTRHEKNADVKMGVVNATGEEVIPIDYDLIGTFAFDHKNLVEVRKDGKTGYYDLTTKQQVVDPVYDMIVPYQYDSILAIVKQDTVYGWIDNAYQYTPGFPSEEAREWVMTFGFLKKPLSFTKDSHSYCEIPNQEYAGYGILIPPSYLVYSGLFSEIDGGICTTPVPVYGWTEYIKVEESFFEKLSANVSALVTAITERYIEGREEFYTSNRVVFLNERNDTLAVESVNGTNSMIRAIDSTLLEVRTDPDWEYYMGDFDVDGLPVHIYYSINDGAITRLKSSRLFPQTQFVNLDSSYLSEPYKRYDPDASQWLETTEVSLKTLVYMRNEILFEYGYRFKSTDEAESFTTGEKYDPQYDSVEEFEDQLSDIDQHNLMFLEKVISMRRDPSV